MTNDLITICSSCKSFKNEEDRWEPENQNYFALFPVWNHSHGYCPPCKEIAMEEIKMNYKNKTKESGK